MSKKSVLGKVLLAVSISTLMACSGGSSSTNAVDSASTTTNTVEGVITGFGSIFVNGVEYETDNASIVIDGKPALEDLLGIGDVVTLQGSVNTDGLTGIASIVSSVDELEGYIVDVSNLSAGIGTINVMGQTVTITIDTVFDSDALNTIDELSVNDIVEISGFPDGSGNILATRVETKQSTDDLELKGVINNLDTNALTFSIGALSIDYSTVFEIPANLTNGLLVEVETQSALTGSLADGFILIASKIEIEDGENSGSDEGDKIERQGLVSGVTDTSFLFNGELIQLASLKIDNDDFNLSSLKNDMLIKAEGFIDANGVYIFEKIEDIKTSKFELKGTVIAKTENTVTVSDNGRNITVFIDNSTRMRDEQDENITPIRYFSLNDIAIGEYLELKYFVDGNGDNIATALERDDKPSFFN